MQAKNALQLNKKEAKKIAGKSSDLSEAAARLLTSADAAAVEAAAKDAPALVALATDAICDAQRQTEKLTEFTGRPSDPWQHKEKLLGSTVDEAMDGWDRAVRMATVVEQALDALAEKQANALLSKSKKATIRRLARKDGTPVVEEHKRAVRDALLAAESGKGAVAMAASEVKKRLRGEQDDMPLVEKYATMKRPKKEREAEEEATTPVEVDERASLLQRADASTRRSRCCGCTLM
mmetsp:Transcript_90/g.256  ORF Transcript_90/g.256 Transcript_90/m.256 type:complete len:236 (-) Transcript_90:90-797(-)